MATNLEARLAALRAEYTATLPACVNEARACLDQMGSDGAALEACWQQVHRIYGTAGSYGLHGVAEVARGLETLLEPYRRGATLPAELADEVREALDALAAQASEAART